MEGDVEGEGGKGGKEMEWERKMRMWCVCHLVIGRKSNRLLIQVNQSQVVVALGTQTQS